MINLFREKKSNIEKKINSLDNTKNKRPDFEENSKFLNSISNVNELIKIATSQEHNYPLMTENNYGSKYYDPTSEYRRIGHRGYGKSISPGGSQGQSPGHRKHIFVILDNILKTSGNDNTNNYNYNYSILDSKPKRRNDPRKISYLNIYSLVQQLGQTKEEVRVKALMEIFQFYANQHVRMIGTFEDIKEETNTLDVGEFMKFCNEFKIQVKRESLVEVYKKVASCRNSMNYDQFLV